MKISYYRKWRPQRFSEIIGQDAAITTLKGALALNKISHAYIFSGPKGTGKTTTARILAKTLNCLKSKNNEPCNKCQSCIETTNSSALDVAEIDAASHRGIDEIKQIIEKIQFSPSEGKYKIFIIDEAHMLTREAFNALLKTLEEPPAHAIFILATTEIHKIPPTILSRCQNLSFKKLEISEIKKYLLKIAKNEKLKIGDEALNLLAQAADGSMRDAAGLLEQVASISDNQITLKNVQFSLGLVMTESIIKFCENLLDKNASKTLKLISQIIESGYNLNLFIQNIIEFLRRLYLLKFDIENIPLTKEEKDFWQKNQEVLTTEILLKMIKVLSDSAQTIKSHFLPQLVLETAVLEIISFLPDRNENSKSESCLSADRYRNPKQILNSKLKIQNEEDKSEIKNDESRIKNQESKILNLTIEQLISDWLKLMNNIKKKNHSLISLLAYTAPIVIKKDNIIIATKYKFSAQKLSERNKKYLVEEIFSKFYNQNIFVEFKFADKALKIKFEKYFKIIKDMEKAKEVKLLNDTKEVFGV